jgi:hypothetical protein
MHIALIQRGKRTTGRAVVAADGEQPVFAGVVVPAQDGRRDCELR